VLRTGVFTTSVRAPPQVWGNHQGAGLCACVTAIDDTSTAEHQTSLQSWIWRSHGSDDDKCGLLGCNTMWFGETNRLHLHGVEVSQPRNLQKHMISNWTASQHRNMQPASLKRDYRTETRRVVKQEQFSGSSLLQGTRFLPLSMSRQGATPPPPPSIPNTMAESVTHFERVYTFWQLDFFDCHWLIHSRSSENVQLRVDFSDVRPTSK
jgi:hypothetical protein